MYDRFTVKKNPTAFLINLLNSKMLKYKISENIPPGSVISAKDAYLSVEEPLIDSP